MTEELTDPKMTFQDYQKLINAPLTKAQKRALESFEEFFETCSLTLQAKVAHYIIHDFLELEEIFLEEPDDPEFEVETEAPNHRLLEPRDEGVMMYG